MFKYVLLVSSVLIALCAAYFSVTGIATLFAGKYWTVLVMASSLELGKLAAASFLNRYWKKVAVGLRTYLTVGVAVLMLITSIGIYGYLSSGYAAVAAAPQQTMNQISQLEAREKTLNDNITSWRQDNTGIDTRRSQAQTTLNSVLAGSTQLNQRSAFSNLRQEIANLDKQKQTNDQSIQAAQSKVDSLSAARVTLLGDVNSTGKIGQFIYVAKALNVPLDTVVKWFVLLLVFVFDPLAVSLILAYNSLVREEMEKEIPPPRPTEPPPSPPKPDPVPEPSPEPEKEPSEPALIIPEPEAPRKSKITISPARYDSKSIAARYLAGETLKDIANDYGCSLSTIGNILEREGVERRQGQNAHKEGSEEPVPQIVPGVKTDMYDEKKDAPPARPIIMTTTNEFP